MKTIKQAIDDYMNLCHDYALRFASRYNENSVRAAFRAGMDFAQHWIPVEEEEPPMYNRSLVKRKNGDIDIAVRFDNCYRSSDGLFTDVTEWRPIEYYC
jgi:hypothetical protein